MPHEPPIPDPQAETPVTALGVAAKARPERKLLYYDIRSIARHLMRHFLSPAKKADLKKSILETGRCHTPIILANDFRNPGGVMVADGDTRLSIYLELDDAGVPGFDRIPGVFDESLDTEAKVLSFLHTSENRSDRNPVDLGRYLKQYMDAHGLKLQKDLLAVTGICEATICRLLGVFEYPEAVVEALGRERITLHHFNSVASLDDFEERVRWLLEAADKGISARQLLKLVKPPKAKKSSPRVICIEVGSSKLTIDARAKYAQVKDEVTAILVMLSDRFREVRKDTMPVGEVMV